MNSRPSPLRRALTAAFCFVLLLFNSRAADTPPPAGDLRTLLRDALFEEEATRDLDKAAAGYESLLTKWGEQRQFAAAALYRLAEVRRKQGRKDDAIKLYQRLVTEFADQDPHARLSRENLTALGAKDPAPGNAPSAAPAASDEEAAALARVQKLAVESPDLLTGSEFSTACTKGWLSVLKFLLSKGVADRGDGLQYAASAGHLAIVRELLALKPLPAYLGVAVQAAVGKSRVSVLKLLLENGASPEGDDDQFPALWLALHQNDTASAELLLEHKASADPAGAATSPLFAAARSGNAPMVQRLLSLKADPNRGTRPLRTPENSNPPKDLRIDPNGSTPLHAAVASGNAECVKLLLDAKANINAANDSGWTPLFGAAEAGNAPLIELLIAAGAAPDGPANRDKNATFPLWLAIESGKVEAIAAVLKGKANPNVIYSDYTPLAYAVGRGDEKFREAATALLLAHGADPTLGPRGAIHEAPTLALKLPLLRGYQYPQYAAKPEITLLFADKIIGATLASRSTPDEQPASLPSLLLAWHDSGGWGSHPTATPDWSVLRLFRKGTDGKMAETLIPIKAGAEFPALQWGDVIEITSKDGANQPSRTAVSSLSVPGPNGMVNQQMLNQPVPNNPNRNTSYGLPSETLAILRGTQTVHVTFKSGDFTRDLTLRGILRVYEPTTTEAPLISTRELVTLIAGDREGSVKIERTAARGGGIIEWIAGSGQGGTALPEEGDLITFTPDTSQDHRRVALRIPGHPGRWANTGDDQQPTLFQFLADFYGPLPLFQVLPSAANNPGTSRAAALKALTPDTLLANLIQSGAPVSTRPYLPWPDWSSVKVRRRVKNLGEPETMNLVVDMDLLADMAALPTDALPEDARKLDIPLKPGDEVELTLLKDHSDAPWPGFDAATARVFQKALLANVTLQDDTGRFRRVTLQWLPPRWLPTPAGVLPIPDGDPTDGRTPWLRARDLANSAAPGYKVAKLTRDGETHRERAPHVVSEYFLRPGDTLLLEPVTSNIRVSPGNNIPRPQISPPAPQPAVPVPQ